MIRLEAHTKDGISYALVVTDADGSQRKEVELMHELEVGVQQALEEIATYSIGPLESIKREFCDNLMKNYRNSH
jgi:hypothetical protein